MSSTAITIRVPEELHERLVKSVDRTGGTKTEWVLDAIEWALDRDEARATPKVIQAAMPRRIGDKVIMPEGIVHSRYL